MTTVSSGGSRRTPPTTGQWKKGVSGNPKGRPAVSGPLKELAKAHTAEALETLVAALQADESRTRVAAAEALLDRGWGRPTQHHELEAGDELVKRMNDAAKRINGGGQ